LRVASTALPFVWNEIGFTAPRRKRAGRREGPESEGSGIFGVRCGDGEGEGVGEECVFYGVEMFGDLCGRRARSVQSPARIKAALPIRMNEC